jgi:hypothetical protein
LLAGENVILVVLLLLARATAPNLLGMKTDVTDVFDGTALSR